jgi:hypothetical protein
VLSLANTGAGHGADRVASTRVPPRATIDQPRGACRLVTKAEVMKVLQHPVGDGKDDMAGANPTCTFGGEYGEVTVSVQHLATRLDLAKETALLQAAVPGSTVRAVPEMGGPALFLDLGQTGGQLHIVRGDSDYLMVSVLGFGNAEHALKAAESIARKALERAW